MECATLQEVCTRVVSVWEKVLDCMIISRFNEAENAVADDDVTLGSSFRHSQCHRAILSLFLSDTEESDFSSFINYQPYCILTFFSSSSFWTEQRLYFAFSAACVWQIVCTSVLCTVVFYSRFCSTLFSSICLHCLVPYWPYCLTGGWSSVFSPVFLMEGVHLMRCITLQAGNHGKLHGQRIFFFAY